MGELSKLDHMMPILIADDFSTMRRIVKNCLKQLGFDNVVEAEDGQVALGKLAGSGVDFKLIISDWNMPNMMGIDFLRAVRADERFKNVPFIMVTAEGQKENIIEAAKSGVSNYIVKPFTVDVLQQKLEAVLCKKK